MSKQLFQGTTLPAATSPMSIALPLKCSAFEYFFFELFTSTVKVPRFPPLTLMPPPLLIVYATQLFPGTVYTKFPSLVAPPPTHQRPRGPVVFCFFSNFNTAFISQRSPDRFDNSSYLLSKNRNFHMTLATLSGLIHLDVAPSFLRTDLCRDFIEKTPPPSVLTAPLSAPFPLILFLLSADTLCRITGFFPIWLFPHPAFF